jgi:menaquinone-dependent protoporphyrinogen oxidase
VPLPPRSNGPSVWGRRSIEGLIMSVLVGYASKHGATREIAERIAATLTSSGQAAQARPTADAGYVAGYDAFVIGAAAYYGHWLKPATKFVRDHHGVLSSRPVWLFTSGPLRSNTTDEQGKDPWKSARPKELDELLAATGAKEHRIFFGALDPHQLTLAERTLRILPAGRALLPEGDFRDWDAIDAWARAIADQLSAPPPSGAEPAGHASG